MGVDVSPVSGVGFKIKLSDKMKKTCYDDYGNDIDEYLNTCLKHTGYTYGQYGSCYSSDALDYCIFLSSDTPINMLIEKVTDLRNYLISNNFDVPPLNTPPLMKEILIEEVLWW